MPDACRAAAAMQARIRQQDQAGWLATQQQQGAGAFSQRHQGSDALQVRQHQAKRRAMHDCTSVPACLPGCSGCAVFPRLPAIRLSHDNLATTVRPLLASLLMCSSRASSSSRREISGSNVRPSTHCSVHNKQLHLRCPPLVPMPWVRGVTAPSSWVTTCANTT